MLSNHQIKRLSPYKKEIYEFLIILSGRLNANYRPEIIDLLNSFKQISKQHDLFFVFNFLNLVKAIPEDRPYKNELEVLSTGQISKYGKDYLIFQNALVALLFLTYAPDDILLPSSSTNALFFMFALEQTFSLIQDLLRGQGSPYEIFNRNATTDNLFKFERLSRISTGVYNFVSSNLSFFYQRVAGTENDIAPQEQLQNRNENHME